MIVRERALNTFLDLVRVNGPSGGEGPIAAEVLRRLAALGCETRQDGYGNVLAYLPGQGGPPLLLNAHLDCVQPCLGIKPVVEGDVVRSDGTTVLGADDRAGVAAVLEALTSIRESQRPHLPLELIFTLGEESGLLGAKALDCRQLEARWGLALDSHGPVGGCIVSAPWHDVITAVVHGRAAHSGVEPEKGISAIQIAASAIASMPLGRIDAETTANVGKISGGTAGNIVPDRVELLAEARSRDEEKLRRQTSAMVRTLDQAASAAGGRADIKVNRAYNGFNLKDSDPIVARFVATAASLGITPRLQATGGGSDANVFHARGIQVLNLSAGYEDVHTTYEHIKVSELVQLCALVEAMVMV